MTDLPAEEPSSEAALGDGLRTNDAEALRVFQRAAEAWPGVALEFESFRNHLHGLGWIDELPEHAGELYLCCACAHSHEVACRSLQRAFLSGLRGAVARINPAGDFVAEALQLLRARLLSGEAPRIATYTGRGPLAAWLRVAATRVALDLQRAQRRRREQPEAERAEPLERSPEDVVLERAYARVFESALRRVLSQMSVRDRNVLRLHFVRGMNIEAIGRIYGVHRATIARWMAQYRSQLCLDVSLQLKEELGHLRDSEVESLIRLVRNDVDFSLADLLGSTGDVGGSGAAP